MCDICSLSQGLFLLPPSPPHLVDLEHVCDVWEDVHVVAEEADVVDAVVADRVTDPRPMGPRLEERGESGRDSREEFPLRGKWSKSIKVPETGIVKEGYLLQIVRGHLVVDHIEY